MNSRVHPKDKTKYRSGNWPAYDRALVQRGDITLWFAPKALARPIRILGRRESGMAEGWDRLVELDHVLCGNRIVL